MGVNMHHLSDSLTSLPHAGLPTRPHRTRTKVQPFSFDNRDQETLRKKQEKIDTVRELIIIIVYILGIEHYYSRYLLRDSDKNILNDILHQLLSVCLTFHSENSWHM